MMRLGATALGGRERRAPRRPGAADLYCFALFSRAKCFTFSFPLHAGGIGVYSFFSATGRRSRGLLAFFRYRQSEQGRIVYFIRCFGSVHKVARLYRADASRLIVAYSQKVFPAFVTAAPERYLYFVDYRGKSVYFVVIGRIDKMPSLMESAYAIPSFPLTRSRSTRTPPLPNFSSVLQRTSRAVTCQSGDSFSASGFPSSLHRAM